MKHKFDYKTQKKRYKKNSPYRDSNPDPQHCNPARYQLSSMAVGEVAAKSRNESTYIHIFTYLFLVHQPAVRTETAFCFILLRCIS